MIRICRCSYCNFESQDEQETIEHEKTHVKQVDACFKIQKGKAVPCVMNVLEKHGEDNDYFEMTFVWNALVTNKEIVRTMSSVFVVNKDAMQEVFGTKME